MHEKPRSCCLKFNKICAMERGQCFGRFHEVHLCVNFDCSNLLIKSLQYTEDIWRRYRHHIPDNWHIKKHMHIYQKPPPLILLAEVSSCPSTNMGWAGSFSTNGADSKFRLRPFSNPLAPRHLCQNCVVATSWRQLERPKSARISLEEDSTAYSHSFRTLRRLALNPVRMTKNSARVHASSVAAYLWVVIVPKTTYIFS